MNKTPSKDQPSLLSDGLAFIGDAANLAIEALLLTSVVIWELANPILKDVRSGFRSALSKSLDFLSEKTHRHNPNYDFDDPLDMPTFEKSQRGPVEKVVRK